MANELKKQSVQVPKVLVEKFEKLGVPNDEASSLMESFGLPLVEAGPLLDTYKDIKVTDESDIKTMKLARETRLSLGRIRCSVENTRKNLKAEFLRKGDAIQAVANYIKETIEPAEEYLELQEKFADIKKAERIATIKSDRIEQLMQYTDSLVMYDIDGLTDETFATLLAMLKKMHDEKLAAEKAEADRLVAEALAKEADDKRIREENEKLRAEAEKATAEKAKSDAAIQKARDAEVAKQAEIEAKHQKELADERAKLAAVEAEQKAKDDAIAKEKSDKEFAEAKAQAEARQKEMDELLAPDKEKLINFSKAIKMIIAQKLPAVKSKQAQDVVNLIEKDLFELQRTIVTKAKGL
jgi:hypothetical protein